ncbi:MAG: hypothetical protein EOM87_00955 [Clostridia bacterium]|nr:hypothetical protein [Clostridia bacterium]
MSKAFMVFCLALATLFFALETEVQGIITFLLFISIILIFERDIMPTYLPILLAAMSVLRMYDSFNIFKNYAWIIVIVIISVVFHIIYYRPRKMQRGKRLGKLFFPYVAVSAALLLGGIGSITSAEYFNPTTLYYVLALGVGMLVSYLIFHKYINPRRDYDTKEYFAFAMFIAGVFAFIMLALQYATNAIPALLGPPFTYNIIERFFSISNNLSTIILMIMPFSFYVAAKKKYGVICFISGVLQGFTMLFSSSRSGLFFSFALTLPLIIITMYLDKAKRKQYAIALAIIAALVAIIIVVGYEKIWIPMFTNYAFRLQDNWKMYLLIAIASILVVSYFIALYVMPKRLQRVLVLATAAVFLIMCAGVFVFWEKALVILVKMDYSRGMMADLAMKNFYRFPIFGTGIGYSGTDAYYQPRTATMHFYHSAPIQIIGSMGLVGVIAYAYMFVSRIRLLRQNKSFFNFTIYLCTLGLYLMSLVNPGIFVPLMFMLQLTLYYVLAEQNTKTTAKR